MQAAPALDASGESEPGTIVTFYSYKGGTGRTMALANSACVLAERLAQGEKVLVVDWDLEAPGLHRYFPPRLRSTDPGQDLGLDAGPGLIDLFIALDERLPPDAASDPAQAEEAVERAVAALDWSAYVGQTEHANIHILRAGRNDDGGYGRRVNTFGWERLFQRAPGIYRAVAERLAREFRWVLIDSRTGVTDISGICTSLLPEKLVVVFTPNRQSLTGVRELVQTATAYRRGHDDLRPLLVLPLPSRIEASMEKLRIQWRHGRPEDGITGYQPMFQALLAECYGLADCNLGPYFDAVQIQQTPDCAYGEVISVRSGSGDRFSLASSYRVFVDRLTAQAAPWEALDVVPVVQRSTAPTMAGSAALPAQPAIPVDFDPSSKPPDGLPDDPFAHVFGSPLPPEESTGTPAPRQTPVRRVFLSHANEDRERVAQVAQRLRSQGYEVFDQRDLQPGKRWDDQIAEALDRADAVVVFWSQAAFASESVRVEAEEGLRRGVLLPVLLDDARPPISFRGVQAADLRRDFEGQLPGLVDDIARIARAAPGERTMIVPAGRYAPVPPLAPQPLPAPAPGPAPAPAFEASAAAALPPPLSLQGYGASGPRRPSSRTRWPWSIAGALVVLAVAGWWVVGKPADPRSGNATVPVSGTAPRMVSVPELQDRVTSVATEIASALKLRLVAIDEQGQRHETPPDGLVLEQSPPSGTQVAEGSVVTLKVATQTASVPSVGGLSLGDALARLRGAGLALGKVESVEGSGEPTGTVVRQSPQAGNVVRQNTEVAVGVAAEARRAVPAKRPAVSEAVPASPPQSFPMK